MKITPQNITPLRQAPHLSSTPKQAYSIPIDTRSEVGQLWRLPTVMAETGLSKTEVYRKASKGQFPKRIKLGANSVAWSSVEVKAWIKTTINGGTL